MDIVGLATDPAAEGYLREIYGVVRKGMVAGIPIFQDKSGEWFVGGYKHIYSIIIGDPTEALSQVNAWRAGKRVVRYAFSEERDIFKNARFDHVLELPPTMNIQSRIELYARNVRKHIRNTIETSGLRYVCENPRSEWYGLYVKAMARHRHTPRIPEWFHSLERHFKDSVVAVGAYNGDTLVGALYCVRSQNYIQLLSIASDPAYRAARVDSGLYDAAIVFAIEHGIRFVDFGPTMQWDQSHWEVKEHFGAKRMYFADASFMGPLDRVRHFSGELFRRAIARVKRAGQ